MSDDKVRSIEWALDGLDRGTLTNEEIMTLVDGAGYLGEDTYDGSWSSIVKAAVKIKADAYKAGAAEDERYVNAITTVVGEVGFHIDAQTRNALRRAFTAGVEYNGRGGPPYAPDFDEWLDQYIEDHERVTSSLDSVSQSEGH